MAGSGQDRFDIRDKTGDLKDSLSDTGALTLVCLF